MIYIGRDVGDPDDRLELRIFLNPEPKHPRGGWFIIAPETVDDSLVYDVVAVEITGKRSTLPMYFGTGEHGKRYRYEGVLLTNLSNPDLEYDPGDRLNQ